MMALDGENNIIKRSKLTDEDFIAIVASERRQSIGFEHDQELLTDREQALNYSKGVMPDMPSLPNRSAAVSTDVADAIESVLPDLMEIFTGGDDVVTFRPNSEADEAAAQQETDYVRQVVFDENDGFLTLYSMFKDALQSKVGVVKWWWEDHPIKPEFFHGKTVIEMAILSQDGELSDIEPLGTVDDQGNPLFSCVLTRENPGGVCKVMAIPPEDFTVSRDTKTLPKSTYCAFRSRPRVMELIEWGYDREICEQLPPYGQTSDEALQLARDTAGEHEESWNIVGEWNMRTVEIVEHYVRVDADGDGQTELWRVVTGSNETLLMEREQVDRVPFAALTPYIVTHRFYGQSIADLLIPIQQIKTALVRMLLDSGYFAMNQRYEVADDGSNENTLADLMRIEPAVPVRVKKSGTINPLGSPSLGFDVQEALEFISTMGEQRTGIVRNAQGLNPDTLHDTAQGMQSLMQAAQMRMRLIARVFAETGVKDLFLGVHGELRKHQHQSSAKIGQQWVPIDCSQWSERSQMSVSVGLGSAGRPQELAAMTQVLTYQNELVKLQGGVDGPLVTAQNVYDALKRFVMKSGEKNGDKFFTNPSQAGPPQPKPDPGAAEAQAKAQENAQDMQQKQAELQAKVENDQNRLKLDYAEAHDKDNRERLKLQMDHEREILRLQTDERMRAAELELKRQDVLSRQAELRANLENKLQIALIQAQASSGTQLTVAQIRAQAESARAAVDLELQAREHEHAESHGATDE